MKRTRKIIQAYHQAPWRRQVQLIGLFTAAVAAVAVVAGVYLEVTARAATAGRVVQELQQTREDLEQDIEDLETELAYLSSAEIMEMRAEKLGFAALSPGAITYLPVDGYEGHAETQLAPRAGSQFGTSMRIPAAYTQSLFDWFGQLFLGQPGR